MLAQADLEPETRDFFKQPFTAQELEGLLKSLRLEPRQVFSSKSPSVKAMGLVPEKLTDKELLEWMAREPRLIRRPLVVIDGKAVVGLDRRKIETLLR